MLLKAGADPNHKHQAGLTAAEARKQRSLFAIALRKAGR